MADGYCNFPFMPSTPIRVGSFMGGTPEDRYMEVIWRIASWQLTGTADLIWDTGVGPAPVVMPSGGGMIVIPGSFVLAGVTSTSGFADEDDILNAWRLTSHNQTINTDIAGQIAQLDWGPESDHSHDEIVDEVLVEGGGLLSSALLFTASDGDVQGYLGTEEGAEVGGSYTLSEATGLTLKVKVNGTLIHESDLFMDDRTEYPDRAWTCAGDIVLQAYSWREVLINGTPTWDTSDGSQLADPERNDTNGRPRGWHWRAP